MKPETIGMFVHKQTNQIVPYIARHKDCGGTVVLNGDKSGYICIKCDQRRKHIDSTTDQHTLDDIQMVVNNNKQWELQVWDYEEFKNAAVQLGYEEFFAD